MLLPLLCSAAESLLRLLSEDFGSRWESERSVPASGAGFPSSTSRPGPAPCELIHTHKTPTIYKKKSLQASTEHKHCNKDREHEKVVESFLEGQSTQVSTVLKCKQTV